MVLLVQNNNHGAFEYLRHILDEIAREAGEIPPRTTHYTRGSCNRKTRECLEPLLFLRYKGMRGWLQTQNELLRDGIPKTSPLIIIPFTNSSVGQEQLPVYVDIRDKRYDEFAERGLKKLTEYHENVRIFLGDVNKYTRRTHIVLSH